MEQETENVIKQFVEWIKVKTKIHLCKPADVYFREKEIWWTSLGVNIGYEQDGKNDNFERPCLILKKFNKDILWVLPITSKDKQGKYYYQFEYEGEKYSVVLSQIRLISSKRLLRKVRVLLDAEFEEIRELMRKLV